MEEQGKEVSRGQEGARGMPGGGNQVVIQNTMGGLVHIGPRYDIKMVAQVSNLHQQGQGQSQGQDQQQQPVLDGKVVPSMDNVRPLWYSSRVMQVIYSCTPAFYTRYQTPIETKFLLSVCVWYLK